MPDKIMDCSKVPSESGCTLRLAGTESEVLVAAVSHAVAVHGHEDTPELRTQLRGLLEDVPAPGFVQVIELQTDDLDGILALEQEWTAATEGARTTIRSVLGADREDPGRYLVVVDFPSADAAAANDVLPATNHFAEQVGKLVTAPPTFRNLDVVHIQD